MINYNVYYGIKLSDQFYNRTLIENNSIVVHYYQNRRTGNSNGETNLSFSVLSNYNYVSSLQVLFVRA